MSQEEKGGLRVVTAFFSLFLGIFPGNRRTGHMVRTHKYADSFKGNLLPPRQGRMSFSPVRVGNPRLPRSPVLYFIKTITCEATFSPAERR